MKKKYDDGDPFKAYRERWTDKYPPERVRELIRIMENDPNEYGNLGRTMMVAKSSIGNDPYKSPVGRVDVPEEPDVTICADCAHCIPDTLRSGKEALAYAKCAKTVENIPSRVNVITGEKISKVPKMEYCSNKNHGDCPDWESKKLSRGTRLGSPRLKKIEEMLEMVEMLDDESNITWEDESDIIIADKAMELFEKLTEKIWKFVEKLTEKIRKFFGRIKFE